MTTKTRADERLEALTAQYTTLAKNTALDDLMKRYFDDNPLAKPYESQRWLNHITSLGAVGPSHADKDYDFWKNRKNVIGIRYPPAVSSGTMKAFYDTSQTNAITLASDDFNRTAGTNLGSATGLNETTIPWTEILGDWGINTNGKAYSITLGAGPLSLAQIDTKVFNQDFEAVVSGTLAGGLFVRGFADNSYISWLQDGVAYRRINGTQSALAASFGVLAVGDKLRINCSGTTLRFYKNEVLVGTHVLGVGRSVADGTTTVGGTTITSATINFSAADVGRFVTGTNIPAGSYIVSIISALDATISQAATGSAAGAATFNIIGDADTFSATRNATRAGLYATGTAMLFDSVFAKTVSLVANDPISVLPDLSGNGNHVVQNTAANQPKFGFGTVSDDFNRANGALGTSDTGQVWADVTAAGGLTIVSNKVDATADTWEAAYLETGMPDCIVQADIVPGTSSTEAGIFARNDGTFNNLIGFIQGVSSGSVRLHKRVGGVYTEIGTGTNGNGPGVSEKLRLVCKGSSLQAYRNDVLEITVTDGANATLTKAGIQLRASDATADNFSVKSLAGGKAVATFDSTDDLVTAASVMATAGGDLTVFVVQLVRPTSASFQHVLSFGTGSTGDPLDVYLTANNNLPSASRGGVVVSGTNAPTADNVHIFDVRVSGNTVEHFTDGAANGSGTASDPITNEVLHLGKRGDVTTVSDYPKAAWLVYEGALFDVDRKRVESYLATRFGITLAS